MDTCPFHLGSPAFWADLEFLADHEDEYGEEWAFSRMNHLAALYNEGDVMGMVSYCKDRCVER